jgi:V-type H+-transporting ATPase proteolipid subunit
MYFLWILTLLYSIVNAKTGYSAYKGYAHLASGLSCGLSALAAGLSIGVVGDAGVRAYGKQQKVFVGLILILIFGEALGLYGLIVALVVSMLPNGPECEKPF